MPVVPVHIHTSEFKSADDASVGLSSQLQAQLKLETSHSDPGQCASGENDSILNSNPFSAPRLTVSQSESGPVQDPQALSSTSASQSHAELYAIRLAASLKNSIRDEEGQMLWATSLIANAGGVDGDSNWNTAALQHLESTRTIPMDWLAPGISRYFATKLKADAAKRPLSVRSFDFLAKSTLVWGNSGRAPSQLQGNVDLEMFAHFWKWFPPLVECIAYSKLWSFTQPRLLHGFLSKGACVTMLQHAPPGTFLLRFSETRLRCFVIVYVTEQQSVQFVPVTCQHGENETQCDGWYVSLEEDGSGVTFATIQDLILSVTVLKFLFPQTPKELAFSTAL
jgi:hypothetical protein